MKKGIFIISLDFELHWGVAELWDVRDRKDYFDTTRIGVPKVLSLFKTYNIHATWATVGFLFAKDKKQLIAAMPTIRPTYKNNILNYYHLIDNNIIGLNEEDDPYHYGYSLIQEIINCPNQELATHTFSHYYCNEEGQTIEQFDADLQAAQKLAKENFNLELRSLVFPRNQFNEGYVSIAKKNGIKVVRSNPDVWFWNRNTKLAPVARAFDTLIPISAPLCFEQQRLHLLNDVLLLPASRFLRPYTKQEKVLKRMKLNRILKEMTYAAKNHKVYHLWWHPHNFGYSLQENLGNLEDILKHFEILKSQYAFESKSMIEMY
ncbi:MAG: polysaccharide deacetylase family protein [Flavobacteriaceae bacterium]|nr:polysaccharide deacetylase family protein [Flavobacteriaceae bacterium]